MADLTAISAGLDAVLSDVEKLTLQQLAGSGRVDQRMQTTDLALRPILRRVRLLVRGLREHQAANEMRWAGRYGVPREQRHSLKQSVTDRGRRIQGIAAKLRRIQIAVDRLYGVAAAPRTEQEVIALAQQAGDFANEFQELQQLVLTHADDIAGTLRTPQQSVSYGGLLATLTFMILLLWKKGGGNRD